MNHDIIQTLLDDISQLEAALKAFRRNNDNLARCLKRSGDHEAVREITKEANTEVLQVILERAFAVQSVVKTNLEDTATDIAEELVERTR
jgi:glucuronate isomerase